MVTNRRDFRSAFIHHAGYSSTGIIFGLMNLNRIGKIVFMAFLMLCSARAVYSQYPFSWSPTALNLGEKCTNTNFQTTVVLKNETSDQTYTLSIGLSGNGYINQITPTDATVAPGQTVTFTIKGYTWTDLGAHTDHFIVYYDSDDDGGFTNSPTVSWTTLTKPSNSYNLTASNITSKGCFLTWNCDYWASGIFSIYNGTSSVGTSMTTSATLTNLNPATQYNLTVKATNSCGTSGASNSVAVLTKPAIPTNFKASNITTTGFTLSWNACTGVVTGYKLYDENNNLLYTQTGTTKTITGKCPSSTYKYKVCAYNNSGESDKSGILSVTTVGPTVSGSFVLCTTGATYTVNNLPAGYTVTWTGSSNVVLQSASGNTAFFKANPGFGAGWIQATIHSGSCNVVLPNRNIWTGKFEQTWVAGPPAVCPSSLYSYSASVPGGHSSSYNYTWTYPSNWYNNGQNQNYILLQTPMSPNYGTIRVSITNSCGTSGYSGITVYPASGCGGYYSVYPNPASDIVNITVDENTLLKVENYSETMENKSTLSKEKMSLNYTVRIYSKQGVLLHTLTRTGPTFSVPVDQLNDGNYILEINSGKNIYRQQLIINHK